MFSQVDVDVRAMEIVTVQRRNIRLQQFGIVRHNRTVIVIVASALIEIIALAGIENEVNTLFKQAFDMSVSKLCGIADCIRRNSVLSLVIGLSGAFFGNNDLEAHSREHFMPERQLLIKS